MPQIATNGGCHRVFLSASMSIEDVAEGGIWIARMNVRACRRNPKLLAEVMRRGDAALAGYARGTFGTLPGTGIEVPALTLSGEPELDQNRRPKIRKIAPVDAIRYEDEPHDVWRDVSSIAETANGQPWRLDCDCGSPFWACYWHLKGLRAGIGVSQPRTRPGMLPGAPASGYGMAHEYTVLDATPAWPWKGLAALPGVHLGTVPSVPHPDVDTYLRYGGGAKDVRIKPSIAEARGVFDGSVLGAMGHPDARGPAKGPPVTFYGSGESAAAWLPDDF